MVIIKLQYINIREGPDGKKHTYVLDKATNFIYHYDSIEKIIGNLKGKLLDVPNTDKKKIIFYDESTGKTTKKMRKTTKKMRKTKK